MVFLKDELINHLQTNVRGLHDMIARCYDSEYFDKGWMSLAEILFEDNSCYRHYTDNAKYEIFIGYAYKHTGYLLVPRESSRQQAIASCSVFERDITLHEIIKEHKIQVARGTVHDLIRGRAYSLGRASNEMLDLVDDADHIYKLSRELTLPYLFYYYADVKHMTSYDAIEDALMKRDFGKDHGFHPKSQGFLQLDGDYNAILTESSITSFMQEMRQQDVFL